MQLAKDGIELRTPCCDRKTRNAAGHTSATILVARTCPACGTRFNVKVVPSGFITMMGVTDGAFATTAEWIPINHKEART